MTMKVCEIFKSIQGESTRAGIVCSFVRLAGCNLSCTYCDTRHAHTQGAELSIDQIMARLATFGCRTVEITGGEPLCQSDTPNLCGGLLDLGYTVLVETNGSFAIENL
ncbi:MAG: radical SAM protein, partial [Chitinivibrionales bacterium]|nr:radical SAM protein [Chitinivibrionales bacterium]